MRQLSVLSEIWGRRVEGSTPSPPEQGRSPRAPSRHSGLPQVTEAPFRTSSGDHWHASQAQIMHYGGCSPPQPRCPDLWTRRDRGLANALDHRSERSSRKTIYEVRSARIYIHHPGGDADRVETRLDHQWVELPADECVAASLALKLDLALDRRTGRRAIGIEVGRSGMALDDRDAATGPEQAVEDRQGFNR